MPVSIFIMLTVFFLILLYYSFGIQDPIYYTDIVTTLLSIIISVLLAYNCVIGIGYNYAMSSSISYDHYRFVPLGLILGGISIYLVIMLIAKITDILRHTSDLEEAENE